MWHGWERPAQVDGKHCREKKTDQVSSDSTLGKVIAIAVEQLEPEAVRLEPVDPSVSADLIGGLGDGVDDDGQQQNWEQQVGDDGEADHGFVFVGLTTCEKEPTKNPEDDHNEQKVSITRAVGQRDERPRCSRWRCTTPAARPTMRDAIATKRFPPRRRVTLERVSRFLT